MGELYTQKDIADQWQKISDEAIKKANESKSDFRADAVYVGGMTVIGGGVINALNGGTVASLFLAFSAVAGVMYSHVKNTIKKDYYEAFSSHALDQKDKSVILKSDNALTLPRFDKENKEFAKTYRKTNALKALFHFRSGIAGAIMGGAVLAYSLPKEETPPATRQDDFEKDTSQGSIYAPKTSLRPVPRPQR